MYRNCTDPLNSTVLHIYIGIQPLGDGFSDDRSLVLLQRVDLGLDVGSQCIDFSALGIEKIGNAALFACRRKRYW